MHWAREHDTLPHRSLSSLTAEPSEGRATLDPMGDPLQAPAPDPSDLGGPVRPPWAPAERWPLEVCRVERTYALPAFGAVIGEDGRLFYATGWEAHQGLGGLDQLPGVTRDDETWRFQPPDGAPRLPRAAMFLPWGAGFNYGHCLLDALPSLLALEAAGLLADGFPALAPPLAPWQRGLVALALPDGVELRETPAPMVRLEQAVFATSMNHFLNHPSAILRTLRERVQARAPALAGAGAISPRRVYLSRRSHAQTMRIMVNEAELEQALTRRGFTIARPESLSPARQAMLMREAEIVVGPTGAGMANAALTPPGARIIEIQPETFVTNWVHAFSVILDQCWSGYFAPAPLPRREVPLTRRLRRGFRFAYRLPLSDFLSFLDARL